MGLFREMMQAATGNYGDWEKSTPPKKINGAWNTTPELSNISEYDLHRLINAQVFEVCGTTQFTLTGIGEQIFENLFRGGHSFTPSNIIKAHHEMFPQGMW